MLVPRTRHFICSSLCTWACFLRLRMALPVLAANPPKKLISRCLCIKQPTAHGSRTVKTPANPTLMIFLAAGPLLMADLEAGTCFQSSLLIADPGTNEPTYLSPVLFSFLPVFARFCTFLWGKWYPVPQTAEQQPGSKVSPPVLWNQPAVWLWTTNFSFLSAFFIYYYFFFSALFL